MSRRSNPEPGDAVDHLGSPRGASAWGAFATFRLAEPPRRFRPRVSGKGPGCRAVRPRDRAGWGPSMARRLAIRPARRARERPDGARLEPRPA